MRTEEEGNHSKWSQSRLVNCYYVFCPCAVRMYLVSRYHRVYRYLHTYMHKKHTVLQVEYPYEIVRSWISKARQNHATLWNTSNPESVTHDRWMYPPQKPKAKSGLSEQFSGLFPSVILKSRLVKWFFFTPEVKLFPAISSPLKPSWPFGWPQTVRSRIVFGSPMKKLPGANC